MKVYQVDIYDNGGLYDSILVEAENETNAIEIGVEESGILEPFICEVKVEVAF